MKLQVAERAQRQADKLDAWWAENRPAAPRLFASELEEVLRLICESSVVGIRWPTPRRPALRRILMPRTKNHIYFVINARTDTVLVVAIWGAPKGRNPKL